MRKIKILHFPLRNRNGGVTQYVRNAWDKIDKFRFQFGFATLDPTLDFAPEVTAQGCKVHYLSCSAEEDEERFRIEFDAILAEGYDVVHLHTNQWKGFVCEEAAANKNVPIVIVHAHNAGISAPLGDNPLDDALERHNRQRLVFSPAMATHFCTCSGAAADFIFGPQIPREKIRVLNNGIDVDRFAYTLQARAGYRRDMGLENNFVVGHVGRFEHQKNHEFLIDTFTMVSQSVPNARLMLIGDGSMFSATQKRVGELGLSNKVLFLGRRTDVSRLYQAMDLFALPSRFEGLALVLVEAQTSGLKTICSSSSLPENTITDNIRALPLDAAVWHDAITDVAREGYERRDRSAEVAAAGYSLKEQIRTLERIYSGLE